MTVQGGSAAGLVEPEAIKDTRESFEINDAPEARRISKASNYFAIYDRYFGDRRDRPIVMLEIGVQHGGSLQMWKRYFHPGSTIAGVDINPDCKQFEEAGVRVFIGDQSDEHFLADIVREIGEADIILDDGSHIPVHQIASFNYLFRHGLKDGGVYVVEDCGTSYWKAYGGGLKKKGSFIEFAKDMADKVNYWDAPDAGIGGGWEADWIESVEFYCSVVAFRKKRMSAPETVRVGGRMLDLDAPFARGKWGGLVTRLKRIDFIQRMVRTNPALWRLMRRFIADR